MILFSESLAKYIPLITVENIAATASPRTAVIAMISMREVHFLSRWFPRKCSIFRFFYYGKKLRIEEFIIGSKESYSIEIDPVTEGR